MNICVFGLGYVGTTTAACLAREGHRVTGVDIVEEKVTTIEEGESPIVEARIEELVRAGREDGLLRATTDAREALSGSGIAFVCVGTPSGDNGALDTSALRRVTAKIGTVLDNEEQRTKPLLVVFRSTMLPGTTREELIPLLEAHSGRDVGDGYEAVFHPEFLREGTAVKDFYNPPKIVVGERFDGAARRLWTLYEDFEAPRFASSIETAEAVKYVDNAFHALKITFANEMGKFLKVHGVDSREVMNIFRQDTKLNISPKYLRPGFSFGGSCLPKDLRTLTQAADEKGIELPMLDDVLFSNERHLERALRQVVEREPERVGIVGLSFKPGTDDLRESPLVELAERLLGKGVEIQIFDRNVRTSKLMGTNKSYIEQHLPHLSEVLVQSIGEFCTADLVVVGHPVEEKQIEEWIDHGKDVVDLVGASDRTSGTSYEGIAW